MPIRSKRLGSVRQYWDKTMHRTWENRLHGQSLAAIILCIPILFNGCASKPPKYESAYIQLKPSKFDYLTERFWIVPLVVHYLRQSDDQQRLSALECMAASPIDTVITGGGESPEFRNLLNQVLAEFKTERQGCLPVSGAWQIITLENVNAEHYGSGGGGEIAAAWAASCLMTYGIVCPVGKMYHFKLVTCVFLPDGQPKLLEGEGHADDWSVTAWKYQKTRDEVMALSVGNALKEMAIQYSEIAQPIDSAPPVAPQSID